MLILLTSPRLSTCNKRERHCTTPTRYTSTKRNASQQTPPPRYTLLNSAARQTCRVSCTTWRKDATSGIPHALLHVVRRPTMAPTVYCSHLLRTCSLSPTHRLPMDRQTTQTPLRAQRPDPTHMYVDCMCPVSQNEPRNFSKTRKTSQATTVPDRRQSFMNDTHTVVFGLWLVLYLSTHHSSS